MKALLHAACSLAIILLMTLVGCASSESGRSNRGESASDIGRATAPVKDARSLGVPWEKDFGESAAIKTGDSIYVSGQMGYDETGKIVGVGDLEAQMRQSYANVKKVLGYYNVGMDRIVEEVIYVTDMKAALTAAAKVRAEAYSGSTLVASTIVQVTRLAVPDTLVEIRAMAKVQPTSFDRGTSGGSDSQGGRRGGGRRSGGRGFPF
jgi:enamine deaminase RidA (YjgF/YER057c/UK114 family)